MATATTAITTNLCLDMIDFQVQLSMGHEFSACLTTDDRLYMWGKGNNGQLGNGYYVDSLEPALAKTPGNNPDIHWVSISCGEDHCVGITGVVHPNLTRMKIHLYAKGTQKIQHCQLTTPRI